MFPKKMIGIKSRFVFSVVIAVSLVLLVSGGYEYHREKNRQLITLEDLSKHIVERLEKNLELPLWELDNEWIKQVLDTEMSEKHLYGVSVMGEGGIQTGKSRDINWRSVDKMKPFIESFITNQREIYHNGAFIGSVSVAVTDKFVMDYLADFAYQQLLNTLLLILTLISLLLLSLQRIVIKPVTHFISVVKAISDGNFTTPVTLFANRQDEIALLADSVERMRQDILKREKERDHALSQLMKANTQLKQDLLEREEITHALNESQRNYRDLYDYSPDMYITINTQKFLVENCNKTLLGMLGYRYEEVIGLPVFDLYHPDSVKQAKDSILHFLETEQLDNVELQLVRKTGFILDVSLNMTAVKDCSGRIIRLRATWRDITVRKNIERELQLLNQQLEQRVENRTHELNKQHVFLETVLENIKDGIVVCDENGILSMFNPSTLEIHGIAQENLPAECWAKHYNLFYADGKTLMKKEDIPLFRAFNGELVNGTEMIIKPENLTPRTVLAFGQPMIDSNGKKLGAVVTLHDITEQKKSQLQLQQAVVKAKDASRAKSIFLANMSHELRTPLNAIIGFSQIMLQANDFPESEQENLSIINRSGQHLLKLINDVLDMSKIEAGQIEIQALDFDLAEIICDVTDMTRLKADEKGVTMFVEQRSNFPRFIHGDASKIKQIFINLLSNAVKYTDHGSISLKLNSEPINEDELQLKCVVEDTGLGMTKDDIQKVFEPFIQLEGASRQNGSGLGLSIAKQFIELMGGNIQVKSQPGIGSSFTFSIIVQTAKKNELKMQEDLGALSIIGLAPGQKRYRVMVVEDQFDSRLLLKKILETAGFTVITAQNGQEAVELFSEWKPDFIWMDQRMPVLDGFKAIKQIRCLPNGRKVIIVILTASVLGDNRYKALQSGANDFLAKPFKINEIFSCMGKHLSVRFLFDDNKPPTQQPVTKTLNKESLSDINPELLKKLSIAIYELDMDKSLSVVEMLKEHNNELAAELKRIIESMDFAVLQKLIPKPGL